MNSKTSNLKTLLLGIGVFAFASLLVLAITRAGTSDGTVYLEARGANVTIERDTSASGNTFVEFGSGGGNGGGGSGEVAQRTDFPIRNTNIDARDQWENTPSDQIPREEFLHPGGRTSLHSASHGTGYFYVPSKLLGQFVTQCGFSHFAYDDPLVFPGKKGAAHLHMFFGNTLTDANSTYDTILNNGSSTCSGFEANRTGYWAPAVFDQNGNVRVPSNITIYYKSHSGGAGGVNLAKTAFPENLGFIGASASGDTRSDPMVGRVSKWDCYGGVVTGSGGQVTVGTGPTIPNCPAGQTLRNHIFMPYCLRGNANDAINNTAQMEYPPRGFWSGACPAGTVELPAIEVFIEYASGDRTPITNDWFVSSDVQPDGSIKPGGITSHTDWFGGWNRDIFDGIMRDCISTLAWCYFGTINRDEALARIVHFGQPDGSGAQYAYTGPSAIPARELSEALCPGDTYNETKDAATCESTAQALGVSHDAHHSHDDHSH